MSKLVPLHIIKHTGTKHTGTVIFFHGSGSSGGDMKEWVNLMIKNFSYPHINILFPTAPLQPYSPAGGQLSTVWFDREDISPAVPEKTESLKEIEVQVRELIKKENAAGIPMNRIIIGGFSMGGALALHTGCRWARDVAGIFAFSAFLNRNSVVYEELKNASNIKLPPLLQIHGDSDDMVHLSWAEDTFKELKELGVKNEFYTMERLGHSINKRGTLLIKNWIEKLVPEV